MPKHYPNCLPDGFKMNANEAFVILVFPGSNKMHRYYRGKKSKSGAHLTSWSLAGAKLWGCFNDAKIVADRIRLRDVQCMVRSISLD